ncbi:MAG: oligosaccharide flippase family protein [Roseburia sp.]|nr:oligosaccharide flippase family protein [Roseburia sp.]MCM1277889.1 oligosaccharide flippase family protein [Robinsoniella sp.]
MKKDIFRLCVTNLIKMMVGVIVAFIIPMMLSVEQYGYLKLYQFYATYLGISHLGFCDGIYLEYGGANAEEICKKKISRENSTLFLYELAVATCFIVIGIANKNFIVFSLGMTVIPAALFTFYTYIYQAAGELKKYTWIMNCSTCINLLMHVGLILMGVDDYRVYIVASCLMQWLSFLLGALSFIKNKWIGFSGFSVTIFYKFVKMGILLMIGNFAYTIFLGIDKWFIKFTMGITEFSLYSFSAQMLLFVNMFVSPVAMTLYSNISRRKSQNFEIRIRKILVVILMSMPMAIYAIEFIVNKFIGQYSTAINIISVLMITQIFLVINTAVFVNLYKAYHRQRDYFLRMCMALIVALVLDIVVAVKNPDMMSYAIATLLSCLVWLIMNMSCFRYMFPSKYEIAFVIFLLGAHIGIRRFDLWLRMVVYGLLYIVMVHICMKDVWDYLMGQVKNVVKKIERLKFFIVKNI